MDINIRRKRKIYLSHLPSYIPIYIIYTIRW